MSSGEAHICRILRKRDGRQNRTAGIYPHGLSITLSAHDVCASGGLSPVSTHRFDHDLQPLVLSRRKIRIPLAYRQRGTGESSNHNRCYRNPLHRVQHLCFSSLTPNDALAVLHHAYTRLQPLSYAPAGNRYASAEFCRFSGVALPGRARRPDQRRSRHKCNSPSSAGLRPISRLPRSIRAGNEGQLRRYRVWSSRNRPYFPNPFIVRSAF